MNASSVCLLPALALIGGVAAESAYAQQYWGVPTRAPGFQKDQCTRPGFRQYSARLWNITGSWEAACAAMPADINGQHFNAPSRCRNMGLSGEWGEFDVQDSTCSAALYWGSETGAPGFQRDQCTRPGFRQYSARLWNITGSWEAACAAMPADINGQHFSAPSRCRNTGTGERGEFDVADSSCDVHLLPRRLPNANPDPNAPVWGFADTHNHQFAHLAFGGALVFGSTFDAHGIQTALPWCTGVHGPGGVADVMGGALAMANGVKDLAPGHLVGGYPQFDGWPRWNTLSHQLEYYQWLKRAHAGGLQLMVMMAVNSEFLCAAANHPLGCDDMQAVDRQLAQAKALEKFIADTDGGWYRIVTSPVEARQAIHAGNLAVVLGIEVANLFGCARIPNRCTNDAKGQAYVREQLQKYFDLGVRHLFAIHATDNAFGGTAIFEDVYLLNNMFFGRGGFTVTGCGAAGVEYALSVSAAERPLYDLLHALVPGTVPGYAGGGQCNAQGLTDLGKFLVQEMMNRHMIVDVDHMSWKAADEAIAIAAMNDYPLISGHSGYLETSTGGKRHEAQKNRGQLGRIQALGGMAGVITAQGVTARPGVDGISAFGAAPNDCSNSSKTFAQAYEYAVAMMGGPAAARVGLATDVMGAIHLTGPRYGDDACYGGAPDEKSRQNPRRPFPYPFRLPGGNLPLYESRACDGPDYNNATQNCTRTFNFDTDGLAHIGMLPDLIQDLRNVGLSDTRIGPLMRSAESYIGMWEKAERFSSGELVNRNSGKCLDMPGGSTSDQVKVQQFTCNLNASQRWRLLPNGEIVNQNSGKCLAVPAANDTDPIGLRQRGCNGGVNQKWQPKPTGEIVSQTSGECLDVLNGSVGEGVIAQQFTCNGSSSQKWTVRTR